MDLGFLARLATGLLGTYFHRMYSEGEVSPIEKKTIEDKIELHAQAAATGVIQSAEDIHDLYQEKAAENGATIPDWNDLGSIERTAAHLLFGLVDTYLNDESHTKEQQPEEQPEQHAEDDEQVEHSSTEDEKKEASHKDDFLTEQSN